ncbi:ARM repeat-containing protein [Calocera cornea HHB12733]|uniref:MMS19 nucleotide excision repair protein n=1 Tax=Calocera cornea HHB12733 TaxID=1353952 RepID=A0A165HMU8_9BASI|nr:ARM repeat-containing protein [Calocera cornea HHB12733]
MIDIKVKVQGLVVRGYHVKVGVKRGVSGTKGRDTRLCRLECSAPLCPNFATFGASDVAGHDISAPCWSFILLSTAPGFTGVGLGITYSTLMSAPVSMDRLIRTYMASDGDEDLQEVVTAIEDGNSTILLLIRSLGEYLTSTEDPVRSKGLNLLSEVLSRISQSKINVQATRVLTKFYVEKLEDGHVLIAALKGILSLASFPQFGDEEAVEVWQGLVKHVKMRAHVQSTRFVVFQIVNSLLTSRQDALKALGDSFLSEYVELANGEKDPRNLLQAFTIDRIILTEFDTKSRIDDLFDITFCYFPISWKPPPGDPYGISTDDLRNSLRLCLSATPAFGPLAMPTFLEKLSATVGPTKIDTLVSMRVCFPVYGKVALQPVAQKMWDALRMEIFQPLNDEIQAYSLKTLISFVQTLYPPTNAEVDGLAVEITQECLGLLKEPERDQAKYAIKTLGAFLESSPAVAKYALEQSLTNLLRLFRDPAEMSVRGPVLDAITGLLGSLRRAADDGLYDVPEFVAPKKDELLSCFVSSIRTTSVRKNALNGLLEIVQIPGLLSEEESTFMAQGCSEILLKESDEEAQKITLQVLGKISLTAPKALEDTCLPLLFGQLPDQAPPLEADDKREEYWRILSALQSLCLEPVLFQVLVVRLVSKLDIICALRIEAPGPSVTEASAAYAHAILETLKRAIQAKIDAKHNDLPKYLDQLVPHLFSIFLRAALSPSTTPQVASSAVLILDASRIITLLTQTSSAIEQTRFITNFFSAYDTGNFTPVTYDASRISRDVPFKPFETNAPSKQKDLVPLLCGSIIALYKEVQLPVDSPVTLLDRLSAWCLTSAESVQQRDAVLQAVCSLVNKTLPDVTPFLDVTIASYRKDVLRNPTASLPHRLIAVELWVWIGRALLVRSDNRVHSLLDDLFCLLPDSDVAHYAVLAIGRMSEGGVDVLTKPNHATIRLLHMQKFISMLLPIITTGAKDNNDAEKQALYLSALAAVIVHIPHAVYGQILPTIMPLLLRCLQLPDAELRANVAEVFVAVANDEALASTTLTEYAPTVVKSLLANSVPVSGQPTSVRLRTGSLKSLAAVPAVVRYDILHPLKPAAISQLGKAVDDRKRSVRKEAVEARAKWYQYHG